MQHLKVKVEFRNIKPFEKLEFDLQLTKKDYEEDLKRFVKTYYAESWNDYSMEDIERVEKLYQSMVDSAIKNDNLLALEILWQGVYWHDRSHPNFVKDVYAAAEFGTLTMLQHCIYGFMNYATYDPWDVEFDTLRQRAERNPTPEILKFIQHISPCVVDGKMEQLPKCLKMEELDADSDPDEVQYYETCAKFYQLIEAY